MSRSLCALGVLLLIVAVPGRVVAADNDRAVKAARLNAELAFGYLKVDDVTTAREKVEKALIENPKDAVVHTAAALVYERLQEKDRADSHYRTAMQLDSRNPDLQNNYAVFLCRNARPVEGQRMFEQAARNPAYATPEVAYTNAAVCARGARDLKTADAYLARALEVRPEFPDALLQRADVALSLGDGIVARASLEHYFKVSHATPEALSLGARLERTLGDPIAASEYLRRLQQQFPNSPAAREARSTEVP